MSDHIMSKDTHTTSTDCCPDQLKSGWDSCRPWSLELDRINCYASEIVEDTMQLGGTTINLYKLLGVHERTKLLDHSNFGSAISSGSRKGFDANNAFNADNSYWMSLHSGDALLKSGYIGYDFGVVRLSNGRVKYGVDANVRVAVSSINIRQGGKDSNRASRVRVERSDDGTKWYGVGVIDLPNDTESHQLLFKSSASSRYWRIRPISFHGSGECGSWVINTVEFSDHVSNRLDFIQDKIWMENRTREYSNPPIPLKAIYNVSQNEMDLVRFGISPSQIRYNLTVSFNSTVAALGRPIVVGDIIEIPMEAMYTPTMQKQRLFLEVTSVSWDTSGTVTPGWRFTSLAIVAKPAMASEETQDIFGDLSEHFDVSGLASINDGNNSNYQDLMGLSQNTKAVANSEVPVRGRDDRAEVRELDADDISKLEALAPALVKANPPALMSYTKDAMPPNGDDYTEGPELPDKASDKQWHRLTYEGSARGIPTRLYRFSSAKNRWIFMESDERTQYNNQNVGVDEFVNSPNRIDGDLI